MLLLVFLVDGTKKNILTVITSYLRTFIKIIQLLTRVYVANGQNISSAYKI